ncbi:MAG: hypothetical protein JNM52_05525 [Betaproteobacteria bacterium]|nr:hypothetical protein [Betaproteobacteria bacterium]
MYRSTHPGLMETSLSISDATLSEVVTNESIALGLALEYTVPSDCQGCTWEHVCRGGDPMHRFRRSGGSTADFFDNRSVYCEILYALHMRISRFLLDYKLIDQTALEAGLGRSLNEGKLPSLDKKQKKKTSIPLKVLT